MLDILYESPSQPELEEYQVTADTVKHKTFGRGRKTFRKGTGGRSGRGGGGSKKKGRESA